MTGNHHNLAGRNRSDFSSTFDLRSLWEGKAVFSWTPTSLDVSLKVFLWKQELLVIKVNLWQKYVTVTINSIFMHIQALKFTQSPSQRSGWLGLTLQLGNLIPERLMWLHWVLLQPGDQVTGRDENRTQRLDCDPSRNRSLSKKTCPRFSLNSSFPPTLFSNRTTVPKWTSRNKGWRLAALPVCQASARRLWHKWRPALCWVVSYLLNNVTWTTCQREVLPSTPTLTTGGFGESVWWA